MSYFETTKDDVRYVSIDGKIYGVKYRDSCGKNNKPFVRFSVAYDYEIDNFGEVKNKYIYCFAWGDIAEIISYLVENNRLRIKVRGKLKENTYGDKSYEQLECTWIDPLFEIPPEKSSRRNQNQTNWEEAETEFTD